MTLMAGDIQIARDQAAIAAGRAAGAYSQILQIAKELGIAPPPIRADIPPRAAESAAAVERAVEEQRALLDPGLDANGDVLPLDPSAVIAAEKKVAAAGETFGAALSTEAEPTLHEALDAGWRLIMYQRSQIRIDAASRPLAQGDVFCLEEVYRQCEAVAYPPSVENTYGLWAQWVELYACDGMLRASEKSPSDMLLHVSNFAGVKPPDPAKQWTPRRAVRELAKAS